MICSICKCENDFNRYAVIHKDGHRWTWGRLCEECYTERKQAKLDIVDAPIPKPTHNPTATLPPGGPVISLIMIELETSLFALDSVRSSLMAIEDYIVHTVEGPSKPQPTDNGGEGK